MSTMQTEKSTPSAGKKRSVLRVAWAAFLLVPALVWLKNELSGEAMKLREVEHKARQLAGPNATFCGTLPLDPPRNLRGNAQNTSQWEGALTKSIHKCEVSTFRVRKPFYSIVDSVYVRSPFQPLTFTRTVTLLTPQGRVMRLESFITRQAHPQEQVKVKQSECFNPQIYKLSPTSSSENLACN